MNTGVLIFVWLCYLKGLKETALAEGAKGSSPNLSA